MTAPEVVPCGRCGRPLSDPESRARGYGRVCADVVLGVDTHRTPVPRPRRRKHTDQIPLPLEEPVTDEVRRILSAARNAAPDANPAHVHWVTRAVLEELDQMIGSNDEDSTWPNPGDLGLLAADI